MKLLLKKIFFVSLIFLLSVTVLSAKVKTAKKQVHNAEIEVANDTDQWYIYWKSIKNIYKGPFFSLEDVLQEWNNDQELKPKNDFFIGKNKRLVTDNPDKYFAKTTPLEETENITEETNIENQEDSKIIIPPVIDPTNQSNRNKKMFLSDFMEIPSYDLPSGENNAFDEDLIADLYDIDSFGRTSLMNAIKAGNDWKVKALLDAGTDINAKDKDGWTALMYAVRYQSNLPILELLLQYNPDIRTLNNYGLSALILASCYNDNPDVIKKMLSFYSPSEKEVQKAFIMLLSTQSISEYTLVAKMKVFIETGIPLNSYYDGKTPLMYACKFSSSTKAIKLLLDNDATLSVRSSDGKTAFEYATENKNLRHDDIYWSLNKR